MKLVDLNLLLYAVNSDSHPHQKAKAWLEEVLAGEEPVAIPWVVLLGFLRISTNPRIFPQCLTVEMSLNIVDGWLAQPNVQLLSPQSSHWKILRSLLVESGTAGNLVTDTYLAALAIENGAELCSTDSDFSRFPRLRWTNPLC
jgi:toxin-antitoxin system PIN domain toxin